MAAFMYSQSPGSVDHFNYLCDFRSDDWQGEVANGWPLLDGLAAKADTDNLVATAPVSLNRSTEHSPYRLNVPCCPQDVGEVLSEVRAEDFSDMLIF